MARGEEVDAVVTAVLGQGGATGDRDAVVGAYGRPASGVEVLAEALSRHPRHRALALSA